MSLVMVWLQLYLFGGWQHPEPWILLCDTSYHCHGSSRPRPPIPVASVSHASCICWNHSMHCGTILDIVPITQPGSSSSLTLPCSVSSSSSASSSPSSSLLEHAISLRLTPIAYNISLNVLSGFLVVYPHFSAFVITSCSCMIAVSASWTRILATAVFWSTWSPIHFALSSLLKSWVSPRSSAESFCFDHKLFNAPNARTLSSSKPLLPSFAWWFRRVESWVHMPDLASESWERYYFAALTIVSWVDFVVVQDGGWCMIWTTSRQAVSVMSRLVRLINLNKAKSAVWLSRH